MQALIQFAYEQKDGHSVPSPYDRTGTEWWWDRGAREAHEWAQAGITDVLLPPCWRGASMGGGYDPYNHYDIGHRAPTRFGSREQLQRFAAICKTMGMGLHADLVCAHMQGGKPDPISGESGYVFDYSDKAGNFGRFPKDRNCFVGPHSGKDNVAAPDADFAYLFGRQVSYQRGYYGNGQGLNQRGYMLRSMEQALRWLFDALDLQGARWDNTKSMSPDVISYWLRGKLKGAWGVGEFYDGNRDKLLWWIFGTSIKGMCGSFDYPLYFQLREACNNTAQYDMRRLVNAGLCHAAPMQAVTFAENHDTDTGWDPVAFNKLFAYAFILTNPGLPCIYAKDYLLGSDTYGHGLRDGINNLLWIRHKLAYGDLVWRDAQYQTLVYERLGGAGLLVGLNNDAWSGWRHVSVQTNFGPNVKLHDYTGHAGDLWTDNNGRVTLGIPRNDNGTGYVCYSRAGVAEGPLKPIGRDTTQIFEGHPKHNQDIPPAQSGNPQTVSRIWCAKGTRVHLESSDPVKLALLNPDLSTAYLSGDSYPVEETGWHTVSVTATSNDPVPYKARVTYRAPKTI